MRRTHLRFGAFGAALAAVVLATPTALATPDAASEVPSPETYVEVEFREGIPKGIPRAILRKQFNALKASPAGRRWLQTPRGRAHAAEVARLLRGGKKLQSANAADDLRLMCDGCEQDYDSFNDPDAPEEGEAGGADGYGYYAACKHPYVFVKFRNRWGHTLWQYYQQLYWCWHGGAITYVHRTRWAYVSNHWMNGWSFHGHIGTNCNSETCEGHWVGYGWARYWTQGKFEVCGLWRWGCRARHPMVGIDVNGWGGWYGWTA
jgi:hypothetical protein